MGKRHLALFLDGEYSGRLSEIPGVPLPVYEFAIHPHFSMTDMNAINAIDSIKTERVRYKLAGRGIGPCESDMFLYSTDGSLEHLLRGDWVGKEKGWRYPAPHIVWDKYVSVPISHIQESIEKCLELCKHPFLEDKNKIAGVKYFLENALNKFGLSKTVAKDGK